MKYQNLPGDNLHEISKPVFWGKIRRKKSIINILNVQSSAELAQRVAKAKTKTQNCVRHIGCSILHAGSGYSYGRPGTLDQM